MAKPRSETRVRVERMLRLPFGDGPSLKAAAWLSRGVSASVTVLGEEGRGEFTGSKSTIWFLRSRVTYM